MNEEDLIETVEDLLSQGTYSALKECDSLSANAVAACSWSATAWYVRGLVLERLDRSAEEMRDCFTRAVELDPGKLEAHRELGYVLDVYFDEFEQAEACFRRALAFEADAEATFGLARVLAQLGKTAEAIECIDTARRTVETSEDLTNLRDEILRGIWSPRT